MSIESQIDALTNQDLTQNAITDIRTSESQVHLVPRADSRLVFLTDPNGIAVEQFRLLCHKLHICCPNGSKLMVTSPSPEDGKTLTSITLAWCLAERGSPTCLVELDFRKANICRTLGALPPTSGVAEILAGTRTISQAIRQIGTSPLHLLAVKESFPDSYPQLSTAPLGPLLHELRERFKWVILDMPPIIPTSDVAEVLPHVDEALMVLRARKTSKSLIEPSLEILGPKLLGVILNDHMPKGCAYYEYYQRQND
jgi:capsular exopolysaccharide synthesis family protein